MENKYLEAEKLFRSSLDSKGKIAWADPNNPGMNEAYGKLVDIFGEELSAGGRSEIVQTMIRNSGYSENVKVPYATWRTAEEGRNKYDVAACIYPSTTGLPALIHEGIHFLAHYGPKQERIILRDIPLANVLGFFFDIRQNPLELRKTVGIEGIERIKEIASNPFLDPSTDHSVEETWESAITAANAYLMSEQEGEQAGIKYIKSLMSEAYG